MDIYLEILKALIDIVKEGGMLGLWGLGIYLVLNLVRLLAVIWVIYNIVKLIMQTITNFFTIKLLGHKERISLVSEDVSKKLQETIGTFSKDMKCATTEFIRDAKDLLQESKTQEKK